MENTKTKNTARYGAGAVIGALLALGGVGTYLKVADPVTPQPEVKVVEKVVEKVVYVEKKVPKVRVYKVSVLDDSGKVVKTYNDISKFEFRIIGATLTTKDGKTFNVDGNISVDKVK